jgi:hypothetical protein
VDEDIGWCVIAGYGANLFPVGGVGRDDAIWFVGQAQGRFFRGNQRGDVPTGGTKKIRASFTGVTAAGEEDARS